MKIADEETSFILDHATVFGNLKQDYGGSVFVTLQVFLNQKGIEKIIISKVIISQFASLGLPPGVDEVIDFNNMLPD